MYHMIGRRIAACLLALGSIVLTDMASAQPTDLKISWEVRNRFRLFLAQSVASPSSSGALDQGVSIARTLKTSEGIALVISRASDRIGDKRDIVAHDQGPVAYVAPLALACVRHGDQCIGIQTPRRRNLFVSNREPMFALDSQ